MTAQLALEPRRGAESCSSASNALPFPVHFSVLKQRGVTSRPADGMNFASLLCQSQSKVFSFMTAGIADAS
jgi:hypothetical protein